MIKNSLRGKATETTFAETVVNCWVGRALSFDSNVGRQILVDNGMIYVSSELRLDDFATMATCLKKNGPLGIGGNYGFFNTRGHFVVVAGWDTTNETLLIVDPAWAHGKDWKSFSYLKHT